MFGDSWTRFDLSKWEQATQGVLWRSNPRLNRADESEPRINTNKHEWEPKESPKGFSSTLYGTASIAKTVFRGEFIGVHSCHSWLAFGYPWIRMARDAEEDSNPGQLGVALPPWFALGLGFPPHLPDGFRLWWAYDFDCMSR